MNPVRGIGGSSPISPSRGTDPKSPSLATFPTSIRENIEFPKKKLTIKEGYNAGVAPQDRQFFAILLKLFVEILQCGLEIVPTQPTDAGGYAVEAFSVQQKV